MSDENVLRTLRGEDKISFTRRGRSREQRRLTLDVAGDGPLALGDHSLDSLGDLGASLGDVVELWEDMGESDRQPKERAHGETDGKLVEGAGILNVLEGGVEVSELGLNLGGGLLGRSDL